MRLELKKHLEDIRQAGELALRFVNGKTFTDYLESPLLRAGVERQLEIIGEALNRLTKADADLAARISDHQRIIAFRNILMHAYDVVEPQVVWDIVQVKLPRLFKRGSDASRPTHHRLSLRTTRHVPQPWEGSLSFATLW